MIRLFIKFFDKPEKKSVEFPAFDILVSLLALTFFVCAVNHTGF